MMLDPLDINGEPPAIVGLPCDELLVSEYWHKGELVEPANVVYLRFGGRWSRLYFDFGIVFWRPHGSAPKAVPPGEDDFAYPLVNIGEQRGIRGVVLDRLEAAPIEGGSFVFRSGVVVVFTNVNYTTTYRAEPGAALAWPHVGYTKFKAYRRPVQVSYSFGSGEFLLPLGESHGESHRDRGRVLQEPGGPCGTGGMVSEASGDAAGAMGRRRAEVA